MYGKKITCTDSLLSADSSVTQECTPEDMLSAKGRNGQEFTLSSELLNFHCCEGVDSASFINEFLSVSYLIFIYSINLYGINKVCLLKEKVAA